MNLLELPLVWLLCAVHVTVQDRQVENIVKELRRDQHKNYVWPRYDDSYDLPSRAVHGGHSDEGRNVYFGRFLKGDAVYSAKSVPKEKVIYAEVDGKDEEVDDFANLRVLQSKPQAQPQWVEVSNRKLPFDSAPVGYPDVRSPEDLDVIIGSTEDRKVSPKRGCQPTDSAYPKRHNLLEIAGDDAPFEPRFDDRTTHDVQWVRSQVEAVPPRDAVVAFVNIKPDATDVVYVGRASLDGTYVPVAVSPIRKEAYTTFYGNEISLKKYDVLVSNSPKTLVGLLKVTTIGSLPHSALNVGKDKEGNAVYAGKAWYHAEYVLGRILPGKLCMYARDKITHLEVCIIPEFVLVKVNLSTNKLISDAVDPV